MSIEYWKECVSQACDECKLIATDDQILHIADCVKAGNENYGMAFYSPPSSDSINSIEREWKLKLDELQKKFDNYQTNAETAVKKALRQYDDADVSIGEYGEIHRHGGRTERIL